MWLLIYKDKKQNSKIRTENEEIINIFVKHAESGNVDEANLYSSCCLKHGYFKPIYPTKCHNLHKEN